jgi:hypothetical protein
VPSPTTLLTALIVGTSQAENGSTGAYLQTKLAKQGYTVTRKAEHGVDAKRVRDMAQELAAGKSFDLGVVFCGSVAGGEPVMDQILQALSGCKQVVWYGSNPATLITGKVPPPAFPQAKTANWWFTTSEAADREKRNKQLKAHLSKNPRVTYVDWRDLKWDNAVVQPNGVSFPSLPDGIHVVGSIAQQAVSDSNWPPSAGGVGGVKAWFAQRPWLVAAGAGALMLWILLRMSRRAALALEVDRSAP